MPEQSEQEQPTTALAERAKANPLVLVDTVFDDKEVGAIANFIGVKADDPAFRPFLAIAASLGLSPLNGEIWLIKGRRNVGGNWEDFYRPAVGRDGFLAKAEESPAFAGLRSNHVCANDTFEVEDDGNEVKLVHRFKSLGPDAPEGKESRYRGAVIGAWAKLFFNDGRPPLFYFAPAHEHVRTKVKDGNREYEGAWSYTAAMCEKAAQSRVLRLGFRLTGVVPVDELRDDDPQVTGRGGEGAAPAAAGSIADDPNPANAEFIESLEGVTPELRKELTIALEQLNDLQPFAWSPAKVRMRLGSDCDEAKAQLVLTEVEDEYRILRDKQAPDEAEDAIEVVAAKDAKPPFELRLPPAADRDESWLRIEDSLLDEEQGIVTFRMAEGEEWNCPATDEIELRRIPDEG